MKKYGIVACSNPQSPASREQNDRLAAFFRSTGRQVVFSRYIYAGDTGYSGSGKERAAELMRLFSDPGVEAIFDVSGGDMANEILDELDFEAIGNSSATFWGFSDLTTVINAILTRTGKSSVLYPVKNLVCGNFQQLQQDRFLHPAKLFTPSFTFLQGNSMKGIVAGGNIRCLLKLAGTGYFPDMTGKLLLIESLSGKPPRIISYLSQLRSCGVFDRISGLLLGTFCEMEAGCFTPDIGSLVRRFAPRNLPIAQTAEIGHGDGSKAIRIGAELEIPAQRPSALL